MKKLRSLFEKQFSVKQVLFPLLFVLLAVAFMADSCGTQTSVSNDNAKTAGGKWGLSPAITEFYEYHQLKRIYEARDNPNLVLNAYLQRTDGQLTCLGKVAGYGVPYGTQWSQPNATGGAVPEPNALYPSEQTSADWVWLIDEKGQKHLTFLEPNVIITEMVLPCHHLTAD